MKWITGIVVATSLIVMPAVSHAAETAVDNKADVEKARRGMDGHLQANTTLRAEWLKCTRTTA